MDINQMWNHLQEQTQSFESLRMNLRKQLQTMEQSVLDVGVQNPLQERMQLFEQLCAEFQWQLRAIEQLRLRLGALERRQLRDQATQLKLDLKLELEQLEKLGLHLMRHGNTLRTYLMLFMLVQFPMHMVLRLTLLPLIIRASKFLPEEAAADLAAFRQRLKRSRKNPFHVQLRMVWHFLETLWAFYIKIKIDNLWLANKSSTK